MKALAVATLLGTVLAIAPAVAQPSTSQSAGNPATSQPVGEDPHTMAKPEVERVQQALVKAGYQADTNGVWSAGSEAALKEFQANRALPATNGRIDRSTLSALGLGKPATN